MADEYERVTGLFKQSGYMGKSKAGTQWLLSRGADGVYILSCRQGAGKFVLVASLTKTKEGLDGKDTHGNLWRVTKNEKAGDGRPPLTLSVHRVATPSTASVTPTAPPAADDDDIPF